MQFFDCSPPDSPTLDDQRDALAKGLGRTMQWARAGKLYEEPLLFACENNLVFDKQCEDHRGEWLWNLIELSGCASRFRGPILAALNALGSSSNHADAVQLCEIALRYARSGDEDFRNAMRSISLRRPLGDDTPFIYDDAMMELYGIEGFLALARKYGKRLRSTQWDWQESHFLETAEERFGKCTVKNVLACSRHSDVVCLRRGWRRERFKWANRRSRSRPRRPYESIGAEELLAEVKRKGPTRFSLGSWSKRANDDEIRTVARAVPDESDPRVIVRLLTVFEKREWPGDVDILLNLLRHPDETVRDKAYWVAKKVADSQIRDMALAAAKTGIDDREAIGLFARNFRPGDEATILRAIELPDDAFTVHRILMEVLDVLKCNPEADSSQLAMIAYRLTPCTWCRLDAAEILIDRNCAPEWLIEECRDDASEQCRKLVVPDSEDE